MKTPGVGFILNSMKDITAILFIQINFMLDKKSVNTSYHKEEIMFFTVLM